MEKTQPSALKETEDPYIKKVSDNKNEGNECITTKNVDCDTSNITNQKLSINASNSNYALLAPDHPLLHRFQQVLKDYLLRTKAQLDNEIAEIKYNVKLKEEERDEQGGKLYDMQRDIQHQSLQLEEYAQEIEKHQLRREEKEEAVATLKTNYEEKLNLKKELKTAYNKRMVELEHMQLLDNNISKWAEEVEDEVKNAKRIVSRDAQLQHQLSEEKKKSDMLYYQLDMEVKKREKELEIVREELSDMHEAINILNVCVSNATTDLEALQNEHKRLTHAWSDVIVAIQHRDKIWFQIHEAMEKQKEVIKLSNASIEGTKKHMGKEVSQNEKLESFRSRLAYEFTNLKRECHKESETLTELEAKLEQLPIFLESSEKDFNEARKEGNRLETEIRRIQWKIDKQYNKKFDIEESILKLAQDQLISDKASEYRLKLLNNAHEQRRGIELTLAQTQNQLSETLLELEKSRGTLFKLRQDNEQIKLKLSSVETKSDQQDMEMKKLETQIDVKLKRIDKLARQLDEIMRTTQGNVGSPTELKIRQLEKEIFNAEQQIRDHQQFWLILQNHFVNLSQKRNNQLNEIQVTQKQLSIIKQKSLKIDYDLEMAETQNRELNRDIKLYTLKVELLNEKIFKKRHQQESQEQECEMEHSDLLEKLKDNEMRVLNLEGEIDDLQTEIEQFKDIVLDKHREALSWETKYKLVEETIRWRKEERNLDSEIGNMKTEIHRMHIRYSQLKRAQEKLVQDLEHCVMHREQIFVAACTKQHVEAKPHKMRTSTKIKHKIKDMRNKIKQIENETNILLNQKMVQLGHEQNTVKENIATIQADIEHIIVNNRLICQQIEEGIAQKQKNLESIVRKQNRAKAYRNFTITALSPKIPRSESTIHFQFQTQTEFNDNLTDMVQALITEFPERKTFFNKILHILNN